MHGLFHRRHLPHLDVPGGTYFVTFCLAGSLPARGALATARRHRTRPAFTPTGSASRNRPGRGIEAYDEMDRLLDEAPAVRWLADARLADLVQQTLLRGHGSRYHLHAYVVMPNHCHAAFTPYMDDIGGRSAREVILHSIKRHTALHGNRLLGRRGSFWQDESFDRLVRNSAELEKVVAYVEHNPVRAGLCRVATEWSFSSARTRPAPHPAG